MEADPGSCLLVDMGNQRLKWRLTRASRAIGAGQDQPPPAAEGVVSIRSGRPAEGETAPGDRDGVRTLDDGFPDIPPPGRILVSAVSHSGAVEMFESWCHRRWGVAAELVASEAEFDGMVNGYDDPSQLGCDRWLAALAAHRTICTEGGGEAVVVVDAGTAVTVDLVVRGRFAGGAILPGIATMVRVLDRETGRIRLETCRPTGGGNGDAKGVLPSPLATNSDDAVHAGACHAVCGGVDRCIDGLRSRERLDARVPVLVTGGDAGTVAAGIRHSGEIRPNLVLDGLSLVAGECSS